LNPREEGKEPFNTDYGIGEFHVSVIGGLLFP